VLQASVSADVPLVVADNEVQGVPTDGLPTEIERLDVSQLSRLIRERRGGLSLRQAAADANVSFSTMSRVEGGSQPDLASFARLCAWLGLPPSTFFTPVVSREVGPLEEAIAHLSTDPRLSGRAATSIADALREMYERLASEPAPQASLVACHLRATPVMRPGVPERLSALLVDMHAALEERVAKGSL
jgi:transcriptional regulator with XRE-family HTH domain